MNHKINEGLRAGDLEGTIEKRFSVDQYKSKMGDDRNICVLAFVATNAEAAKDLERFAEKGYPRVLDADATPGTMEDGKYRVFVELPREPQLDKDITNFLDDLKKLTNIDNFEFTYHKRSVPFEANSKNLADVLPRNEIAYDKKISSLRLGEVHSFFDKFNLIEFKLDNNVISVKKNNTDPMKLELHQYGDTQSVLKEIKAFDLSQDAVSECIYFTKYFGPYNISKTNEGKFVFSKENKTALVSKHNW